MKIDLHCHTKKSKGGDPDTREVDETTFREAIISSNVEITAITNHNVFDIKQYYSFVSIAGDDFQVWPGIELDVKGINKNGHVVIVNNPKSVELFDKKVKEMICDKTPDEVLISIEELLVFFNQLDAIILPHYYKPKSLDEYSIEKIKNSIDEKYRFFYEPSSYRTLGILINHDQPSLMGSDVKDWSKYSQNDFSELKLDVDSFDQFLLLAKKDASLVETLLHKKKQTMIDIGYKSTGRNRRNDIIEEVPIYDDINIIFGPKGTGKSNVLDQIKKYYTSKNINYSYYTPSYTDDEINSKLKIMDSERSLSIFSLDNCSNDFNKILNWEEAPITQLKDFIDYSECKKINKNKEKLKILNTNIFLDVSDRDINKQKDHSKYLSEIYSKLEMIELNQHINDDEIKELYAILNKVNSSIHSFFKNAWVEYEAKKYSNYTVEKIKNIVEENTETKTKPSKTGLFDFVNNRLELIVSVNKICSGFMHDFVCSPVKVGELEKRKVLYMVTKYKMLDFDVKSKADEFKHNITKLRDTKDKLFDLQEKLYEVNINECVAKFNDCLSDYSILSLDDFLGVKKVFTLNPDRLDDVEEYTPSTGEATMIILQEKLNDNKDVFLLDEPEKSLGNTYVNEIIVPRLISLAKSRKVVIVVTHNANIAVRTFPYTSILKIYEEGKYKTFVGNPFVDELVQIGSERKCLNWKDESIKILEGGIPAFDERGEIYGRK